MADIDENNPQGFEWDEVEAPETAASSPDQVAVVTFGGEVVVASPAAGSAPGTYDLDLTRLPSDFNLAAAINMRRETHLGIPRLSEETRFLTIVSRNSERTKVLALSGDIEALTEEELFEWLIQAERNLVPGTDDHPLFETPFEETACSVVRLPNNQVALTEVPRPVIDEARSQMSGLSGSVHTHRLNLCIETPVRCAFRYYLTALPQGQDALAPGRENEVTALILIARAGFSFGLWNPKAGLFTEYGFPAPVELTANPAAWDKILKPKPLVVLNTGELKPSGTFEARSPLLEEFQFYVRQAFDQLALQLSPETAGELGMSSVNRVVWATEIGLDETVGKIAEEYSSYSNIEFFKLEVPADEAIASGLLLGSFNFGYDAVPGADVLPQQNLARDLMVLADKEEMERRRLDDMLVTQRRSQMVLTLLLGPILLAAFILGSFADLFRSNTMLSLRESAADARLAELKPAIERRKSYENTLKWYQEFIAQVSALRKQQPVAIGMLYDLNSNYPLSIDPGFYISDLKLGQKGEVEIKGFARSKDAVTTFLRSLEFWGGEESGQKIFGGLAYEVREGVIQMQSQGAAAPTMAGSTMSGTPPAPGVVAWTIKGTYLPVEALAPKPKPKTPPPPPAGTGAAPATN